MWILYSLIFILACISGGNGGCTSEATDKAQVSVKVTRNGKPLKNVVVTFWPEGGRGRPAAGETDAEGYISSFTTSQPGDGVQIGAVRATVVEATETGDNITGPESYSLPGRESRFPARYGDSEKSGLEFLVNEDASQNNFEIDLN